MVQKFPANDAEFPKCEPFNRNTRNSGSKVEWKENFWKKIFENLGITREVVLFFGRFGKYCSIRY